MLIALLTLCATCVRISVFCVLTVGFDAKEIITTFKSRKSTNNIHFYL